MVVPARTGDELSHGQAQNVVNFDFEVKFDFDGQNQSLPKTIMILTKVLYIYGPNLLILAERVMSYRADKLVIDARTDTHTDKHRQRQYPKAKTGLG